MNIIKQLILSFIICYPTRIPLIETNLEHFSRPSDMDVISQSYSLTCIPDYPTWMSLVKANIICPRLSNMDIISQS